MMERIFIVEDEAMAVMAIMDYLKLFGYSVCGHSAHAEKALQIIPELAPDLVLMDIRLAGNMDGIELASVLTSKYGVGVVFMTAYTDEDTLAKTEQVGAFAYLVKPIEPSSLRATIRLALQKHKIERALRQALRKIEEQSETIQRSEALYRGIVEFASDAIITMDSSSIIIAFNNAAEKLFGYSSSEIVGKPVEWLIPTNLRIRHAAAVSAFSTEPGSGRSMRHLGSMTCLRQDGSVFPSEIAISRVNTAGRTLYTAIVRDMTERLATEKKLVHQNILITHAQKLAKLSSWEWDLTNNSITVTEGMNRLPGQISEKYNGDVVDEYIKMVHPGDRASLLEAVQRTIKDGNSLDVEYRHYLPDGDIQHLHALGNVVSDDSGMPVRIFGSLQDISERKRAEHELRQLNELLEARVTQRTGELKTAKEMAESANQAKTRFLANMSHELRNPLSAIMGFADMLVSAGLPDEPRGQAEDIRRAGTHLMALIDDLLDLARIEVGRPRVELTSLPLTRVFAEATSLTSAALLARRIQYSCHADGGLFVQADGARLRQVLVNLLSNAAKYTHEGGRVALSAGRTSEGHIRISVTDDGVGIPAHKLKDLFVPFERLGAEKTPVAGDGIGLALSRKLVELMGGRIGVESVPGHGTTFFLDLPAGKDTPAAPPPADVPLAEPRRSLRVLYIEDDPINRRLMQAALAKHAAMSLRCAERGSEGLAMAEADPPDVILVDMHLGDMDGYDVLQALRQHPRLSGIPAIAVSAAAQTSEVRRALEAGYRHYLTKPFSLAELSALLLRIGSAA